MAELGEANIGGRMVPAWLLDLTAEELDSLKSRWYSNPNLLDNWYFGRPVNQRGGTEWLSSSSSSIPCVDRWTWWGQYITGTRLNLLDDGLQLAKPAEGQGQGLYQAIVQKVEKTRVPVGATVTLSALVKAENDASVVLAINDYYNVLSVQANVWELITFTVNAPSVEQTYSVSIQRNSGGIAFTVKAVKLELGSTQTLAHREGDKWILNEVPDYGEQLRRCQRYAIDLNPNRQNVPIIGTVNVDGTTMWLSMPIPTSLRTTPVISNLRGVVIVSNDSGSSEIAFGNDVRVSSGMITIAMTGSTKRDGFAYLLDSGGAGIPTALLSADL